MILHGGSCGIGIKWTTNRSGPRSWPGNPLRKRSRGRGGEAGDAESYYGDAGASGKGDVGRGVDEEVRFQGKDVDGGPIA
jgi:hypothetical protein